MAELSRVVTLVNDFCTGLTGTSADISALQLALEELVTNVITHGYCDGQAHSFTVTLENVATDRVRALVTDDAPAYNPLARPEVNTSLPLEERPIGGLGVHLIKKLMDVCIYERRDGQNIFTIKRRLNRASSAIATANIAASKRESSAVLALTGRLDGLSSPELEHQVSALIKAHIRTLIFDLSALDYVSSAGLRVFILAAKTLKAAGGGARFAALKPSVKDVFDLSGLLTALDVRPSVETV